MSPRDIEIFRALMTAGTTARAAELLGISQPAVSQAIQRVESFAAVRLFERIRGRMIPTNEANVLMTSIERYFVGFETVEHVIRSLGSYKQGRLVIACFPALGNCFLPRAIAGFHRDSPGIQLSLQVMSSREVHQQVQSGVADIGLMASEMPTSGLEHSVFSALPGVIAMAPDHPLAQRAVVTPADLQSDHFISLNAEDVTRRALEAALAHEGITLRTVVETPYSISACEFARSGVGLAFVHPVAAIDFIPRGLVIKRFSLDVPFQDRIIFRPGKPLSEHTKSILKLLRLQLDKDCKQLQLALKGRKSTGRHA
ncbi:TPA: LysR family transcriptional regulator [Burkholderia aenigmatica]|uniref:LysR substrate-binding domain-containing protein n=1 Tax=Burkholderia sp. AU45251 TaxID=3059204 RepID=UPI002653A7BE|nr:LysR substrate-binding domain-containing protein [Burkholderia sp. AU45251]HDR9481797.1 LysR family transcriptional regulator [Burkholderia aenigmatica]MDN7513577.1 LysR substrate-binding domain-containing protein [Burkholderia sp. AU45251]HDR9513324.1 LysR family transcriptional regulator [Burkholderia aenigmatica]HDR9590168.1 LysR family transcriptional regulator [Burkholderia aenigmatica]HDR9597827.1 LysR family transcriptional regulator [Burkholderia aenigmatica]